MDDLITVCFGSDFIDSILTPENSDKYENDVYLLPKLLDEKVARLHLDKLSVELTELREDQADYIGVKTQGPFKTEEYRY